MLNILFSHANHMMNFIELTLPNCNQEYALWWFLPLIILGALAGFSIVLHGESAKNHFENENDVQIAILGPNAAGKTTLWNFFRGMPSSTIYRQTIGKEKVSFKSSGILWNTVEVDGKKDFSIGGYDINGNGDYIRGEWENIIKQSNMLIFVFNSSEYLNSENYKRDVNQRLSLVKYILDNLSSDKKRGVWLLGSHADKLKNRESDWLRIVSEIKKKPYSSLAENNFCVNLTNRSELEDFFKKMF